MGAIFNNGFKREVPGVVIGGTNQEYGGSGFLSILLHAIRAHESDLQLSRQREHVDGKHTLQFGAQLIFAQRNETNGAVGAASGDVQGLLTFSNINGGYDSTGNAFANFLRSPGTKLADSTMRFKATPRTARNTSITIATASRSRTCRTTGRSAPA